MIYHEPAQGAELKVDVLQEVEVQVAVAWHEVQLKKAEHLVVVASEQLKKTVKTEPEVVEEHILLQHELS